MNAFKSEIMLDKGRATIAGSGQKSLL